VTALLSRRAFLAGTAAAAGLAALPRPAHAAALGRVVRVGIHPAVGVARVGNSADAFYFGPEVPSGIPSGPYKDPSGAMAKQAARFRLYGYDRDGVVVAEITADDAEITWTVQVGNGKAAGYGANEPLDLPDAQPMPLRNPLVTERGGLAVVSRRRTIRGASRRPVALDGGVFAGTPVRFGEVFTDGAGRLVVMPGDGEAIAAPDAPAVTGFSDNDGWTDTTCDGPIRAQVRIGDRVIEAAPARVLCAGPNYGPGIGAGLVTAYDAALDGLVRAGRRRRQRTQFHRDIAPLFARITDTQWVNAGFLTRFGAESLRDWTSVAWQRRLRDRSESARPLREAIAAMFRDPDYRTVQPTLEPQMYGDMIVMPPNRERPRQWLAFTSVQYAHLQSWARGDFTLGSPLPTDIADVPVRQQPATLDRAALDGCLGGAFHPGVEFPWLARVEWLWTDDLRLRSAANQPNVRTYGELLTPAVATSRTGPLSSLGPGDLVKWMGVPWQVDAASCRFGYQRTVSPVLPGFWPARIPNSVLSADDYRIVMDTGRTLQERRAAFRRRVAWERAITSTNRLTTLSIMLRDWPRLGVIAERPGPSDGAFPRRMKVETGLGFTGPLVDVPAWAGRTQLSLFPLVVANSDDNLLRSVDASGGVAVMTTSAGLGRPEGIAVDGMGELIVACMDAGTVVRVQLDGTVETIVGGLASPIGVAIDPYGVIYVCGAGTSGWLIRIDQRGRVTDLPAPSARFIPHAVAYAPDGALLVADNGSGSIVRYDPLLGTLLDAAWITGLSRPKGMAWDSDGALYVVERSVNRVRRFDPDGGELPFTLSGVALDGPFGIAYDGLGSMYVSSANATANRIDRIALAEEQGTVSTFATGMSNPGGVVFRA
jgi:sugar lactone lactonase YvrE